MKINIPFFLFLFALLGFQSCYETPDWLEENTTPGLGNFPVIAAFSATNGTTFQAGETVNLDLRFWSVDPIQEIVLSSTIGELTSEVASFGYTPNFDAESQTDKLLMDYNIPTSLDTSISEIILDIEIINENTLTRNRQITVAIE